MRVSLLIVALLLLFALLLSFVTTTGQTATPDAGFVL
jgi:hypothetical protein